MYWKRLILVAGPPRGGTTWFGKVLSEAKEVSYIFEPITHHRHPETRYTSELKNYFSLNKWYLDEGEEGDNIEKLQEIFRLHTEELVKEYFGGPVGDLVIKIPQTEKLGFFVRSLNADKIIYVKRNPLALLNSYDKSWLFKGWRIRDEYNIFLEDLPLFLPEILPFCNNFETNEIDISIKLFHARNCLIDQVLSGKDAKVLEYEVLAASPFDEFKKIFNWLGWGWSEELELRLSKYFFSNTGGVGFLDVQKNSSGRISSWRKELAPWQIKRGDYILELLQSEYATGNSNTLEFNEMLLGVISYFRRRIWRANVLFRGYLGLAKRTLSGL